MISDQQSAEWVPALLQISDPLFPTGAYAHSMGLEQWAATCENASGEDLEHFFKTHAGPSLARLELPYLRFLRVAVVAGHWAAQFTRPLPCINLSIELMNLGPMPSHHRIT